MVEKETSRKVVEAAALGWKKIPQPLEKPIEEKQIIPGEDIAQRQQTIISQFPQPYIDAWGYFRNNSGDLVLVAYDYSRRPQIVMISSKNGEAELKAILEKESE